MRKALLLVLLLTACGGDSPTLPAELWNASGTGNSVVDVPDYVNRVTIAGSFTGNSTNFVIWCNGDLLVNELLGTGWDAITYSGIHQLESDCEVMEIEDSTGVSWTIQEIRN